MRIREITIAFLLLISPLVNNALAQVNVYSDNALAEKIYVQTDGLVYTTDQTIWFKGIVLHGSDLKPSELSGVLYVDFIDSDEVVLSSKKLKLEKGITHGSIVLDTLMNPGKYLLRAYTNWNLNFDEEFMFKQYIDVFPPEVSSSQNSTIGKLELEDRDGQSLVKGVIRADLLDSLHKGKMQFLVDDFSKKDSFLLRGNKGSEFQFEYPLESSTEMLSIKAVSSNGIQMIQNVLIDTTSIDLRFFPEGGDLINEMITKVGFKAVDISGKGKQVQGKIFNSNGERIKNFKSNALGMGFFVFEPKLKEEYYALVGDQRFDFPKVLETGAHLAVKRSKDKIILEVNSNLPLNDLRIDVKAKGVIQREIKAIPKNNRLRLVLNSEDFVEGILSFRLKEGNLPLASRSYFNHRQEASLKLDISTAKGAFKQREKGTIDLEFRELDTANTQVSASLLVLNNEQLGEIQQTRNNIFTHMLLTSEIKGTVESPNIYFDEKNKKAWNDLEALMLTQGWSRYAFKDTIGFNGTNLRFQPEPGLMVRGKVSGDKKGKKKKNNVDLTLATFGSESSFLTQTSDDQGDFAFQVPDEYGQMINVIIQSVEKGKQKTFNIEIDKHEKPAISFDQRTTLVKPDTYMADLVEKHQERKLIEDAWRVETGVRDLGEFIVEDYELTPEREEMMEKFGAPSDVIEGDEMRERAEGKLLPYGLFGLLQSEYYDLIRVYRYGADYFANVDNDYTLYIVDGKLVEMSQMAFLQHIPISEVKSFEIIRNPKNFAEMYQQFVKSSAPLPGFRSIISIYTYSGNGVIGQRKAPGIFQGNIPTFSYEQEFYAPKYENLSRRDWLKPDYRALIHWDYDVEFDANGKAEIEFYNADNLGEMLVVVEVVTSDGKVAYKTSTFKVEEQTER